MKKETIYLIMKRRESPVYTSDPQPHLAFASKDTALEAVIQLNTAAARNRYWIETVKFIPKEAPHD